MTCLIEMARRKHRRYAAEPDDAPGHADQPCLREDHKSLAIGSLNAMGLAVSLRLVMNLKVVLMLLRRLAGVIRNMTQGNRAAQQV